MTGWIVAAAFYAIGFVYYVTLDRWAWKRQGIPWTVHSMNRKQFAWPVYMLSETLKKLRD